MSHRRKKPAVPVKKHRRRPPGQIIVLLLVAAFIILVFLYFNKERNTPVSPTSTESHAKPSQRFEPTEKWLHRAYLIDELFHYVYTPCWEGAYGAIGDAYLFGATHDSSLLHFHLVEHDLRNMCEGTWVDDRAWICLAEFLWWDFTGRKHNELVEDARRRYSQARAEGRLSNHEGFWSWYNWPPQIHTDQHIFTNSNMNQMVTVACRLYEATGEKKFLDDALLVWNGDATHPGIEKTLYRGHGVWEGRPGLAAFGKQIPWDGAEYCSIAAALFRVTKNPRYKKIIVATANRIIDPASGWVDARDFYQIRMDGNGAFVNFLLDGYAAAPDELPELLPRIGTMLDHVWTNGNGAASVTLHRESDHGIRNGWNPHGGEDGYGVNEVGTVHAQGEAIRAFGTFAYYMNVEKKTSPQPFTR